jgi:hypothetical protein
MRLMAIVALVVGCTAVQPAPTEGCPATAETAGSVLATSFGKQGSNTLVAGSTAKTLWLLRAGDAPDFLRLSAERRGEPWARYDYTIERTPDRPEAYASDFRIDEPGCWSVRRVGGSPGDEIVLRVEPATGQRPSRLPEFASGQRPEIIVNGVRSAVAGCGPVEVAEAVTGLFAAYSDGDGDSAAGMLAPYIGWFTFTRPAERGGHVDVGRPALIVAYVATRHAHHERLALTRLWLNGSGGGAGGNAMNVAYEFEWSADEGSGRGGGKGALECPSRKLVVWSMGEPAP